jgi:tetratricopeptide (TPR) repeat protein
MSFNDWTIVEAREDRAIATLDLAIERAGKETPPPEFRDLYYLTASAAHLVKGNQVYSYHPDQRAVYQKEFKTAVDNADGAIGCTTRYLANAYKVKANALEDLAEFCGQTEMFAEAIKALNLAIAKEPSKDDYQLCLGRVYYKSYLYSGVPNSKALQLAARFLTRAQELLRDQPANYWPRTEVLLVFAPVSVLSGDIAKGDQQLKEAIANADPSKLAYVYQGVANFLGTAPRLSGEKLKLAMKSLRERCDQLRESDRNARVHFLARLKANSWQWELDMAQAKAVLDDALNSEPKPNVGDYVELLILRGRIILGNSMYAEKELPQAIKDGERAVELTKNMGLGKSLAARSAGLRAESLMRQAAGESDPKKKADIYKTAKDGYADALNLDPDNPAEGPTWHLGFAFAITLYLTNAPKEAVPMADFVQLKSTALEHYQKAEPNLTGQSLTDCQEGRKALTSLNR